MKFVSIFSFERSFLPNYKLQAVALLVVAMAAASQAFYYSPYFYSGGLQCFPQRCQACRESFDTPLATYDCEGKCGLCDLCEGSPNNVADCARWCVVDGRINKPACVDNCNKGKQICTACAGACGLGVF